MLVVCIGCKKQYLISNLNLKDNFVVDRGFFYLILDIKKFPKLFKQAYIN